MRFVRHATKPEWGLGVVAANDGTNLQILFEGVGSRKIAGAFAGLLEVVDDEVPATHPLRKREDWPKVERDGVRAEALRELPQRFDSFVEEFLRTYPEGLHSTACEENERNYKVTTGAYARRELAPDILHGLMASGDYAAILQRVRRSYTYRGTQLVFPYDLIKFGDIPASAEQGVAERIVRLVEGGDRTPAAVADFAAVLAPHGAAKWSIVTLLPFLLFPERWPLVRPNFIKRTEAATGIDVEYDARPNARTFELVRDLYERVAVTLGDRGFAPRDFIDVQTFLWVGCGMAREAREAREKLSRSDDE